MEHEGVNAAYIALAVAVTALLLTGCPSLMPPSVDTTSALVTAPKLDYDGVFFHVLIDSTGVHPNPKFCLMLMAEIVKFTVQAHTFDFVSVEDTTILAAATVQEIPRKAIISPDSLEIAAKQIIEVEVSLIEYDKGDSVTRVLVGLMSGGGAVGIEMRMVDRRLGHVVVAGKFRDTVRGIDASEYDVIKPLARSVAFYVDENMKDLARAARKS